MADAVVRNKIVAVVEPGSIQQQISAALGASADFQLVDIYSSLEKLTQEIRAAQPHIMLIDHHVEGQPTLDTLYGLALDFPDIALVAVLPDSDPVQAQQIMLAGARAFIIQPFTQVNLLSTLRRVRDLETRRHQSMATAAVGAPEGARPLKVIAIYAPRGGVGCTTLAINLAVALHAETDQSVLLMEGKLQFGHLGLMLNIRVATSVADLVPHMHALDDGLIREVVEWHASGIQVLLAPTNLEVAQGVRPDALYNIAEGLRATYEYVVIDGGSLLDENAVTLLDVADQILLVTVPDLAALHDASRFIQISRALGYPAGKVATVLNRAGLAGGVKTKDIETALRHEVFAYIPDDGPNALRSVNRGIPLMMKYPRSPASRAIRQLAAKLIEADMQETMAPTAGEKSGRRMRSRGVASARTG